MFVVVSIAVIVSLLVVCLVRLYNSIVQKDNRCEIAWQTMDEQLKRRSSLVPRLTDALENYPSIDKSILAQLLATYEMFEEASTPEAEMAASAKMTSALDNLLSSLVDNRELVGDETLDELRIEFEDVATKLSYARASYNGCVFDYNHAIGNGPGKLISGSRFRARESFEAVGDTARHPILRA